MEVLCIRYQGLRFQLSIPSHSNERQLLTRAFSKNLKSCLEENGGRRRKVKLTSLILVVSQWIVKALNKIIILTFFPKSQFPNTYYYLSSFIPELPFVKKYQRVSAKQYEVNF